ncbi:MAG: DUF433 domain-containing protein [Actinomycetota bacterium]
MTDPRFDLGLYAIPEVARLVRVPPGTLRNWVVGYRYPREDGSAKAMPVIKPTVAGGATALSFVNLVEALTLAGFREMGVPLQRVRRALDYATGESHAKHLLASERLLSDGLDLFWEFQERTSEPHLVNMSRGGQKVFPEAVRRYLREVEWGRDSFASRWWPGSLSAKQGPIVVDPRRAFGAPVLAGTGIRTEDLFARFSAGDTIAGLGEDYGLTTSQVESAIRLEASLLERAAA